MFFDKRVPRFPLDAVADYRLLAKRRLPQRLFALLDGGAFEEVTLKRNKRDFESIHLRKRVLKDVATIDLQTEVLGQQLSYPLILAPVAFAGVFARRGEVQAARAAEKAQIPFSLSTMGICSIEEVKKASSAPFWYQFYLFKERRYSLELLERARAAGCAVLLVTVDLPVLGPRNRYERSRRRSLVSDVYEIFSHLPWWVDVHLKGKPLTLGNFPKTAPHLKQLSEMRRWMGTQVDAAFCWKDIEWIRAHFPGKIILKGILDPADAKIAKEIGVEGIVVSNHGGRHCDSLSSTIAALPSIVQAVGNEIEILIDGGISSGLDLVKALALGARACMIGKAWAFGLASCGERGVSDVLEILRRELRITLAHLGVAAVKEIDRTLISKVNF
jgi:L-lactate dehydrogenase (cytochrome)